MLDIEPVTGDDFDRSSINHSTSGVSGMVVDEITALVITGRTPLRNPAC
ncbi:hypothetical protein [Streptomyces sp. 3213.3]|nr:hypothetical protein [Streptomyces sp. 3213.3]